MENNANPGGADHHARLFVLRPASGAYVEMDAGGVREMSARRRSRPPARPLSPPVQNQVASPALVPGPDGYFITVLMQVQKHLGEIDASLQALTKTVDSTKSQVNELMAWKNRIVGGALVLGVLSTFVLALLGIGFKTFYDTIKVPQAPPVTVNQPPTSAK